MTQPDTPPADAVSPLAPGLSDRATRGVAYTLGQTLVGKAVTLAGQVALAWLLDERDYGYVALAFVVAAFIAPVQQGGISDILIRRGRRFGRWATDAFWMSMALGVLSTLLMLGIASRAAEFFGDQRLVGLIMLLSLQNIPQSLCTVPDAELRIQLRFRLLAAIALLVIVVQTVLSVLLAWRGFQAYSFILPIPIVALVRAGALWYFAPPRIGWRISIRRWRFLWGDNAVLLLGTFLYTIPSQGDYLILGRLFSEEVVGQYFWAFNLSTQSLQALAISVGGILLPSLALLQREPRRQLGAFLRASKILGAIAVPASLLQAATADSLVRLIFAPRWYPAIPIFQVLSLGWTVFFVIYSAASLMKATGRFFSFLGCAAVSAIVFVVLVYVGAKRGQGVGAAIGVAIYAALAGPGSIYVAIRPLGGTLKDTLDVFVVPLAASLLAIGSAWLLTRFVPVMPSYHFLRLVFITVVGTIIYIVLLRQMAPATWSELKAKTASMLRMG